MVAPWRMAATVAALGLMLASAVPRQALGVQVSSGDASPPDNLVHPPGTVTAPLGTLGHVERGGSGAADLLLVPGGSFGWEMWRSFMERNRSQYRMWAVTLPGYAGTPPPPMPASDDMTRRVWSDAVVEALSRLIDEEGMDHPVIVTQHLMADYYGLRLALEYPDKVGGVVVVSGEPERGSSWLSDAPRPTPESKAEFVQANLVPFFRTVTRERWMEGTYQAWNLSKDPAVGERLFRQQGAAPLPVQVRYFLEFLTSQLGDELGALEVPLLVLKPRVFNTLDAYLERFGSNLVKEGQTLDDVREAIVGRFGSEEEALKGANGELAWRSLDPGPPRMRFEYVDGSGIFVTEDQLNLLDHVLAEWIESIGRGAGLP